jgi:hypothetical protein
VSIDIDALLDKATPLASRDDAGESLQRIASSLPPVVQGVGELRALINSLPAPTPPSLRPARAGDAVGVMASSTTAASGDPNQLATGGVGQTSGGRHRGRLQRRDAGCRGRPPTSSTRAARRPTAGHSSAMRRARAASWILNTNAFEVWLDYSGRRRLDRLPVPLGRRRDPARPRS